MLRNQRGVILIAAYLVIVVLLILGSAFILRSVSELRAAERSRNYIQDFYLAEAGMDRAAWRLMYDGFARTNAALLYSNAAAGQAVVGVDSVTFLSEGDTVIIKDDNDEEMNVISTIAGTALTMQNNLANTYTTGANAVVSKAADLTADAAAGQKVVVVDYGGLFSAGSDVVIKDDWYTELNIIASINENTLTMKNDLQYPYTVALGGIVDGGFTDPVLGNVGSYTMWVHDAFGADDVKIYSKGTITGNTRRIAQSNEVPPCFLDYAIFAGGDVHTQGAEDLTIEGAQLTDAPEMPPVDFSYYEDLATESDEDTIYYVSGNYTFAGGTVDAPASYSGIWYVDGKITVQSNVIINGSIIATGNVDMKNESNITVSPTLPYPALMAEGNFDFKDAEDITINGLIYVGADMDGNLLVQGGENIVFTGVLLVAGNLNLQWTDSVGVIYDPVIKENPPPGFLLIFRPPVPLPDWGEI